MKRSLGSETKACGVRCLLLRKRSWYMI